MLLHPVIFPVALHGALQSCHEGCLLWVFYQGKGSNVRGRRRGVHGRNGMEAGQGLRWRQGLGLGLTETNGDMDEASKAGAVTIPKNVACNNLNPNCVSFKSKTVLLLTCIHSLVLFLMIPIPFPIPTWPCHHTSFLATPKMTPSWHSQFWWFYWHQDFNCIHQTNNNIAHIGQPWTRSIIEYPINCYPQPFFCWTGSTCYMASTEIEKDSRSGRIPSRFSSLALMMLVEI